MAVLGYSSEAHMALAEEPIFPSEEEVSSSIGLLTLPFVLQDRQTYFIKFYGDSIPSFFPRVGIYYNLRQFPNRLFEIGFRNKAGLTRIGPLFIHVESNKISKVSYDVNDRPYGAIARSLNGATS
jgi:hypothetical protein